MQLRLTRRALADLALDAESYCRRDASEYVLAHPVVRAFVERRSQSAIGQETTAIPKSDVVVYNLHAGRFRGLTWHDAECDVVWLLGVGWHESGSREDAYAVLKQRDNARQLLPELLDYEDLEPTEEELNSFVADVAAQAPTLVALARERPGVEVTALIAGRISTGVVVEVVAIPQENADLEEVWVGFGLPPRDGPCPLPPQPEWIETILAAMVPPSVGPELIEFGRKFPRPGGSRPNEIVACWVSNRL